jgi:cation:H+ antiporter
LLIEILQLLGGLLLLNLGANWLVQGACLLATRLGVSPLAIGCTIVAAGTSAPELVVSVHAAISGQNDISMGNIVGSNICNIGLILGVAALLRPMSSSVPMTRVHTPLMIGVSLLLMSMLHDGTLGPVDGTILLVALVAYMYYTFWESKQGDVDVIDSEVDVPPGKGIGYALLLTSAGCSLLLLGANLLVDAAVDLATKAGVSQAFIGLTIVDVGTSLPELSTSIVAALRNQGDLAIGNAVGSCLFNILGILGLTAVIEPLRQGGVTGFDFLSMLGMALLLMFLLFTVKRLGRGSGLVMLAAYVGYLAVLSGKA